jgi:hypothetical protein
LTQATLHMGITPKEVGDLTGFLCIAVPLHFPFGI